MAVDTPEPMERFEAWLLHRVAQAVEAGEVSADLLADLQAEFETARDRPQQEGHAAAVQHLADLTGLPEGQAVASWTAIERQPLGTREMLLRPRGGIGGVTEGCVPREIAVAV